MTIKTKAVQRLDDFISDNYDKLQRAVSKELHGDAAREALHMTYLMLVEKEERGVGCYDPDYGTSYEAYVFGALYGVMKGLRRGSVEITESGLIASDADEGDEGIMARSLARTATENYGDRLETANETVAELVSVCDECGMPVQAVVNAVRAADKLPKTTSYLSRVFAPLRKAAQTHSGIVAVVEDFMRLYGSRPQEVETCLSELGVAV
ncbi:hypothetical protein FACS1894208_02170 [Clostridia bacterium]|nr:hypothetical protein FACS1894208_02170 [Clostridia bacterium]